MSWLSKAVSRNKKSISTALNLIPGVGSIASTGFNVLSAGGKNAPKKGAAPVTKNSKRYKVDGKIIVG